MIGKMKGPGGRLCEAFEWFRRLMEAFRRAARHTDTMTVNHRSIFGFWSISANANLDL